jgi:hypothetical protein
MNPTMSCLKTHSVTHCFPVLPHSHDSLAQLTGQPSVLYRAATILEGAGFSPGRGAASVAVLLGVFKLVMTLVAVAKVGGCSGGWQLQAQCAGHVLLLAAVVHRSCKQEHS